MVDVGPSWTSNRNDFSFFFWSTSHPDTFYPVSCWTTFNTGKEVRNRFSRQWLWWPSWMSHRNYFSYFWFIGSLDTSYQVLVSWLIGSRVGLKQIFKIAAMATILDFQSKSFLLLWSTEPRYFLPSFESIGLSVQEKKFKIDFQDVGRGDHLGLSSEKV